MIIPSKLINYTLPPPSSAQVTAQNLVNSINSEFNRRLFMHRNLWDNFWNNKTSTASDIISALGTDAALVFNVSNESINNLTELSTIAGQPLSSYLPVSYFNSPSAVRIHSDGHVSLNS